MTSAKHATAPEGVGVIHADFIKSAGKTRIEGKEYIMKDGDVVELRFNV